MTIVLLVRHGLTDYVATDRCAGRTPGIHLNAEGKRQAAALAQRLRTLPIRALYSSPVDRAAETAQALAEATGLQPEIRTELAETETGEWTGRYYKDIVEQDAPIWTALQAHPRGTRIPGGETIDEVEARMAAAIDAICRDHHDAMVAVVSHADPIKAAICHYIGLDLDHFQSLVISPASVSVLAVSDHGAALLMLNYSGDLSELAAKPGRRLAVRRITWPQEGQRMPSTVYELKPVIRITATAVGEPGQRTFYIQARDEDRLLTLVCEKEQVAALALGINQLMEELNRKHPDSTPDVPIPEADLELEQPLEPAFRVGQLGLGFDADANALVLVADEIPESEEQDPDTLAQARFWATRSQMRALSRHATAVVAAGRPLCPLCGEPMDPSGHICPKRNGHKKIEAA
jgi:probable phosphomutase (TIGR03848 family)/uncharacterized repeat protein (TIGR03847 family)